MSILRAIFAYEMPRSPRNLFRYMGCIVGSALVMAWICRDNFPIWQGFLIFYVCMRVLSWLAQFTPFAKSELLK